MTGAIQNIGIENEKKRGGELNRMGMTLKMLRAKYDFTQGEAGAMIGVSEATWSNWEKGKSFPDVIKIMKIEEVFDVKYDDIIFLLENHGLNVKPHHNKNS